MAETRTTVLTREGDAVFYRDCPNTPQFGCLLDREAARRLLADAPAALTSPAGDRDFWLRVLTDSLRAGGQLVFSTCLPGRHGGGEGMVAARTLFQFDGDTLIKIDGGLLDSPGGDEALEAHLGWTGWCFQRLGTALSTAGVERWLGWLSLAIGVSLLASGAWQAVSAEALLASTVLRVVGTAVLLPGFLPGRSGWRRYLGAWSPVLFGAASLVPDLPVSWMEPWRIAVVLLVGVVSSLQGGLLLWPARMIMKWWLRRRLRGAFGR